MCSIQSQNQVLDNLKKYFPKADQFQIVENFEQKGNQYVTSRIIHLTFEFKEEGIQKRKSFILKQPGNNDTAAFLINKLDYFTRERIVYDLIIPRINYYLEESLTPLHYTCKTTEPNLIILENLATSGYEASDSNRRLCDLNQCLRILKALAHFHATSHKIGQTDPQLLQNNMLQNSTLLGLKKKALALWEPIYCEILAQNNLSFLMTKLKKVFQHANGNWDEFTSTVHHSNFEFHVLSHGDFGRDNVLLKYGPNNAVEGVKLIDFQTCFWSSPIYDFMSFFTRSANLEVVENHYETLVNGYIACLNDKLKEMNCSYVYGKENFMDDIRSLRMYTILNVTACSFSVFPSNRSELVDSMNNGKTENFGKYKEICLGDKLFTQAFLCNLKLFDKLGLFEP